MKLYRPDDYAIFIEHKPNQWGHEHGKLCPYRKQNLLDAGFLPVEDELRIRKLHEEYLEFQKWHNRPDGHGGIKGSTIEEFRRLK